MKSNCPRQPDPIETKARTRTGDSKKRMKHIHHIAWSIGDLGPEMNSKMQMMG
jgi:hypothetical protein